MAVGALAVRLDSIKAIEQDLAAINKDFGVTSEIKWTNCKRYYGKAHKAYIDYLFSKIISNEIHFHIRFSPMQQYDHKQSGERQETDTVSKAYFQLVVHRAARYYGNQHDIMLRFDSGECTELLPGLTGIINYHARQRYAYCTRDCVVHAECLNSSNEPMLQLLDVTLGALSSYRNGRHAVAGAHATKSYLAEYAFKKTGARSIVGNTPLIESQLSIWNVIPAMTGRGSRG
jgi:hypothetical protein